MNEVICHMKIDKKALLFNILIPLTVGVTAAIITRGGIDDYAALEKPPLSPPGWVFPVVWTILYILMGIAAYIVMTSGENTDLAVGAYAAQLAFNFVWPIIFFGFGQYMFAFAWIIALWALIFITILLFSRISKTAALLLVPYLLWVTFAAYLNFGVYMLN